jgi:prophage maintenance system killer protein
VSTSHSETEKSALHYLTLQDVLWINLQVTKKVQHFSYARLEEGVFYQYGYGKSTGLLQQAARFLSGFSKLRPFAAGNDATAFVGALAFLKINGKVLNLADEKALDWVTRLAREGASPDNAMAERLADDPEYHPTITPDVPQAISAVVAAYPHTISSLVEQDREKAAS